MPLGQAQVVVRGRTRQRGFQQIAPGGGDQRRAGYGPFWRQIAGFEEGQPGPLGRSEGRRVERGARQVESGAGDFEGAPAGAGGQRLLRFVVGVGAPGGVGGLDVGPRQRRLQPRGDLTARRAPVVPVHGGRIGGQRSVRLQPRELAARVER